MAKNKKKYFYVTDESATRCAAILIVGMIIMVLARTIFAKFIFFVFGGAAIVSMLYAFVHGKRYVVVEEK